MHLKSDPTEVIEQYGADHGASDGCGREEHRSHLFREHQARHGGHDTQQASEPGPPGDFRRFDLGKTGQSREGDSDEQRY